LTSGSSSSDHRIVWSREALADKPRSLSIRILTFVVAALLGLGVALLLLERAEQSESPSGEVARARPSRGATDPTTPPPGSAATDVPNSGEILPTALPLSLVATMVRDDPSRSLATISDEEQQTRQVLAPGQPLQSRSGVALARVERERVLIDNRGVLESLAMDRSDAPAPPDPPPFDIGDEERIRQRVLATRIRELTDRGLDRHDTPPDERPRIGLLAEGSITPVYDEDDAFVGVQIGDVEEGGIYDRIGVEDGDVLTSVNGIPFGEPAAAAAVVAELTRSDEIEVGVTRPDGSAEMLTMPTAELREHLAELEAQVFPNSPDANTIPE
jgi:type II secretion system protein C